jgi:AraC-like DNA-binding protein
MNNPGRGQHGKFIRTSETAERQAEALRLRSRGLSYQKIAEELGYNDASAASKAIKTALDATIREPAEDVRALELGRLDDLYAKVSDILDREHYAVSNGRVVRRGIAQLDEAGQPVLDEKGEPRLRWVDLLDDGPAMAAADRLLRIQERRARLLGLDSPVKQQLELSNVEDVAAAVALLRSALTPASEGEGGA